MDSARILMESNGGFQKSYFYLDGSFDFMHFLPISMEGIRVKNKVDFRAHLYKGS